MRAVGWLVVGALATGCTQAPVYEETGDATSNVQRASAAHFTVATTALTVALAQAQRATGALIVPRILGGEPVTAVDGTPIRATCGVTFIDRTHAITAGHCADDNDVPDPAERPLDVELIDVAPNANWQEAAKITGTFPDYEHPAITRGYTKTTLSCTVVNRCLYGDYQCPPAAKAAGADILMLECPQGLPADREPVAVAASDAERSGAVKAFWFHEIYDAPIGLTAGDEEAENAGDLFEHYTAADPNMVGNFHYFGGDRNQLLPLVSADWSATSPRRRLGRVGNTVWTDLFGCHGTSGSGVMQLDAKTGRYELLGPVANGGRDWGATRLCTDLATHRPGQQSLSYTALSFTQELAALAK